MSDMTRSIVKLPCDCLHFWRGALVACPESVHFHQTSSSDPCSGWRSYCAMRKPGPFSVTWANIQQGAAMSCWVVAVNHKSYKICFNFGRNMFHHFASFSHCSDWVTKSPRSFRVDVVCRIHKASSYARHALHCLGRGPLHLEMEKCKYLMRLYTAPWWSQQSPTHFVSILISKAVVIKCIPSCWCWGKEFRKRIQPRRFWSLHHLVFHSQSQSNIK